MSKKIFKNIKYVVSNQHRYTFNIKAIKEFVYSNLNSDDYVLNLFAGENPIEETKENKWINNDLYIKNEFIKYNEDALELLRRFSDDEIDVIIFDPPYANPKLLQELYGIKTTMAEFNKWIWDIKKEIARVLKVGGKVISIGYETNGIGSIKGFQKEDLLVVAHGGLLRDTFVYTEVKVDSGKYCVTWKNRKTIVNCNEEENND